MALAKYFPKFFIIVGVVTVPLFMACKDEKAAAQEATPQPQELTLEQKKQMLQNAAPANTATTSGTIAMNPAHGQPGHRCDIPVGAPLNSATGASNNTPVQTIDLNKEKTVPMPSSAANGINPPHGQPGHRCDIKVGDPL